jgi:hypothetical protein
MRSLTTVFLMMVAPQVADLAALEKRSAGLVLG